MIAAALVERNSAAKSRALTVIASAPQTFSVVTAFLSNLALFDDRAEPDFAA